MSGRPVSMTVQVTGGAGYVGSHAAAALIAAGLRVVILNNLSIGHLAAVTDDALFVQSTLLTRSGWAGFSVHFGSTRSCISHSCHWLETRCAYPCRTWAIMSATRSI